MDRGERFEGVGDGVGVAEPPVELDDGSTFWDDVEYQSGEAVLAGVAVGVVHQDSSDPAALGGADVEALDLDDARLG